jgi:hypothetical protein
MGDTHSPSPEPSSPRSKDAGRSSGPRPPEFGRLARAVVPLPATKLADPSALG